MSREVLAALIVLAALWGLVAYWQAGETAKAMAACQKTHTYETCFYMIER